MRKIWFLTATSSSELCPIVGDYLISSFNNAKEEKRRIIMHIYVKAFSVLYGSSNKEMRSENIRYHSKYY